MYLNPSCTIFKLLHLHPHLQATEKPFITVVYERDPLAQWVYGRVVLLGEAAHPCTPHIGRSTNMSFADADALGKAVAASSGDLEAAALAFQTERLSKANQEVSCGRPKFGCITADRVWMWSMSHILCPIRSLPVSLQYTACRSVACNVFLSRVVILYKMCND